MNSPLQPPTSPTAIASIVCGLLSWCLIPFFGAIAAIICGHIARSEIRRAPAGTIGGDGLAVVGLILGWAHLAVVLVILVVMFAFFGGLGWFALYH